MAGSDSTSIQETLNALPCVRKDGVALLEVGREESSATSFRELADRVARLATGLKGNGKSPDGEEPEKVMLFAPASANAITAALGILRAGKIVVPVDTQMPDEDLLRVLENGKPARAITTQRLAKRLQTIGEAAVRPECFALEDDGDTESWEALMQEGNGDPAEVEVDDMAVLFYTSGTTGPPKGVPLSHRNLRVQLEAIVRTGLIREDDRVLLPLPLHHVYPFVIGMLVPMAMGIPVVLPGALTGSALKSALREGDPTVSIGVPRLYEALLNGVRDQLQSIPAGGPLFDGALKFAAACARTGLPVGRWMFRPLRRRVGPRLRLLASGGSPLDPGLARRLEAFGWDVAVGYGLTETAPLLTLKAPGKGPPASVGPAIEGVELKLDRGVLDGSERPGDPGELLAKGPNVFEGYFGMEEETAESFTGDGYFRTGDLARIEEGQVFLEGRISSRIALQGGENVDPARLEEIYTKADGVAEIGVLEDKGKLAALVVPEDDLLQEAGSAEAASRLKNELKARGKDLPSYQRLARVEISTRPLERTRLGKLRRHSLETAYQDARSGRGEKKRDGHPAGIESLSSGDRALLENQAARDLWKLLCERYPDRPVEPDAHLEIDLGIDSMEWIELSTQIESDVRVAVDETLIGRVDRVRDLLEAVADAGEAIDEPIENPEQVLSRKDRRRVKPQGRFRLAISTVFFQLARLVLRCFFPVEARGLDRLPKAPFILAPNHVSYLDAPCLGIALGYRRARQFFWAAGINILSRNLAMRAIGKLAQVVPVDPRRSPRSSLAFVALLLDRGHPLVWFPEGRISPDGTLQPFQPGIGMILMRRDLPVVPVYIKGTRDSLPPGRVWPRRSHVHVHFGEPCPVGDLKGDDAEQSPKAIAEALREKVARLEEPPAEESGG